MTDISFFDGLSGASGAPTEVKFNGTDITEIKIREGAGAFTTAWTSVPPAPTPSTSYNYLSDATDGSGNPQPHFIPDFSTPTATIYVPSQYASDVYSDSSSSVGYKKQFGCGGTAIDGDVCAVIAKMGGSNPVGDYPEYGMVFIYERSQFGWSFSASFGGIPGNANTDQWNHMGGYESSTGSAIAVHNGRVFVSAGSFSKSVYIFSKDAGTWSLEARVTGSSSGIEQSSNYSDDISLSVHGGIIAMGLPHARGDIAHTGTSNHSGIVAVYVAPSKDEWVTGTRGQTVPWTYWMSQGAYAEDDNDSYHHMNMGFSVAVHDGRASGGKSVIVGGVAKTVAVKNSHYYWISNSSHQHAYGASFNSSSGIVDPDGVVSVPTTNSTTLDAYWAETQASLCGWGNDITFLASTGADSANAATERLYQLDDAGGSWDFSFMQYINAYWGGINENMNEDHPGRRGHATILADRLIVAGGRYDWHPVRSVFMREQTGAGGASQNIVQGDYFIDAFNGGLPDLNPSGGSVSGGGVTSPDSQNADFEGYVNFHGDLSSYWTANQSSLEATHGNKRGWGEAHWYTAGIKEGREMKYQFTTYDYDDGVKIYEG